MTVRDHGELAARVSRDRDMLEAAMTTCALPDGSTVRVARFGAGPVVVCAPTVPELGFVYLPHALHLAERFEVVIYEPRMSRTARVTVVDRAAELRAVAQVISDQPVHLLSWSDAGSVIYRAARDEPDAYRTLTFMGLPDRYVFPGPLQAFTRLMYRRNITATVPPAVLAGLLAHFLSGPKMDRRWVFGEARAIDRLVPYFRHSILPCMLEHAPKPGEIDLPTLYLAGDDDTLVTVEQMRRMAAMLGDRTEFVPVTGGEHILGYAAPEQVNAALEDFYDRHRATAGEGRRA